MKKKTVLIFGTFDLLHPGHLSLIKQASRYGHVTAVVARDKNVRLLKKKTPHDSERSRLARVARLPMIHRALLGDRALDNRYHILQKVKPDIICLGYDQTFFTQDLPAKIKTLGLKTMIIRLRPFEPHRYKTSKLAPRT